MEPEVPELVPIVGAPRAREPDPAAQPAHARWARATASRTSSPGTSCTGSPLYREVYAPARRGAPDWPSPCPPAVIACSRSRSAGAGDDYSDAERDLADRARPFLIQAYLNALAFESLRAQGAAPRRRAARSQRCVPAGLTRREAEVARLHRPRALQPARRERARDQRPNRGQAPRAQLPQAGRRRPFERRRRACGSSPASTSSRSAVLREGSCPGS